MRTYKHNFTNSQGHVLAARLDMPTDDRPAAYALFAHCFTGSKNWNAVRNIARALTQEDIAVLRFDFTGLGESEGDFSETNFSSNVDDIVSAANYMLSLGMPPQILIGHSLGGAASLMASHQIPSLKATVTIGAPADPEHVKHLFDENIETIYEKGEANVVLGGRKFKIKKHFIEDLQNKNVDAALAKMKTSLLILHSPQDKTVGIDNAATIYKRAKHPKSFVTLDGADHLLTDKDESRYVGQLIASWSLRYIDRDEDKAPESELRIASQTEDDFYTQIKAGKHMLTADESKAYGGADAAASPYDLLLASLGASSGIAIRQYAKRHNIALETVKVHLEQEHKHGYDLKEKKVLTRIKRLIEFEGVDGKHKQGLLDAADQCPVFLLLKDQVHIETDLM